MKPKLIRITTVPLSLEKLLGGQLAFMNEHYEVIAISSDQPYLERIGEKENIQTYCINMTRKITPFDDLKALWESYLFLKKERPMIVHTHTPKAGIIGMLAAWLANVPYRLHTVAGLPLVEATGSKRKVLNHVEKITYKCATNVYPNSHGLKEIIIKEKLCSEKKLKVIANGSSNGINTSFFNPSHFTLEYINKLKSSLHIQKDNFVFIFIGRLVADKGINELTEAFDKLSDDYKKAKLLLIGPREEDLDPLRPETISIINSNENIIETGYKEDIRPYLAISNILLLPSYREGFPNVVMQAGAMGLPAVVTDINGCNEIITEGENGSIIPVKNTKALFEKMTYYLDNPSVVRMQSAKARHLITKRYEQKVVWEALLKEYKTLEKPVHHVQTVLQTDY